MLFKDEKTRKATVELLAELYLDDGAFFKAIFPEAFAMDFSPVHEEMLRLLKSPKKNKLILAPRGIGKTTIARGIAAKNILYSDKKFIVYIGRSFDLAEMQTENLKRDLLTSTHVRRLFGDIRTDISSGADIKGLEESFSKKSWTAFGRTIIMPRGRGQAIRGANWRNNRPDLIIFDDPEDRKELQNEEIRIETKKWMLRDVLQAGNRLTNDLDVVYIDTLKHSDALPTHLMKMEDWDYVKLAICTREYKSLAPAVMSDSQIANLVAAFRDDGELDMFWQEYMNEPLAPESALFKPAYFKHYNEHSILSGEEKTIENIVMIDPARTRHDKSDDTAIVCVGIQGVKSRILVRDVVSGKYLPDEIYDIAFEMVRKWKATALAYEVTGLNEFISYPIKNAMAQAGMFSVQPIELKAMNKKKELRIGGLIPLYRKGIIHHNPICCGSLEQQLLEFPYSKKKDIMDIVAYVVKLCGIGSRYMMRMPETAEEKARVMINDSMSGMWPDESEYEDLANEPDLEPLEEDWRLV